MNALSNSEIENVGSVIINEAYGLHRDLGPGLLESVYEIVLAKRLERRGLTVERQKPVEIRFDGIVFDQGFRADLVVENTIIVELKSVETLPPVAAKQLHTYLRLTGLTLGFIINFGSPTFKEGVRRIVNGHADTSDGPLRIHRS